MAQRFRAYRVEKNEDGGFARAVTELERDDLPPGEVLIRVHYSSLNYKDALSATGNKGVTRHFPHTPGIDAAGVVEHSDGPDWKPGDEVIVTSYDLGMDTDGGLADYIRVPAAWVVRKPPGLTLRESMILGTAGLTAALCVQELVSQNVQPQQGDILVTGASGGVGCLAVAILAKLGYRVVAGSGKADAADWLRGLGAAEVVGREALSDDSGRPLLATRWAGSVDTVGGEILATTLKRVQEGGAVACCGLVASPDLPTSVLPFILRGVRLLGVDSQSAPMERRQAVWESLATSWKLQGLDAVAREVDLDGVDAVVEELLQGGVRGRVVVRLAGGTAA